MMIQRVRHFGGKCTLACRGHFQFQNSLIIFPIADRAKFSVNIYGAPRRAVAFSQISNLFTASTIDQTFAHDGSGSIPGIKDDEGNWNTNGHRSRLLRVDEATLTTFASLYESHETFAERSAATRVTLSPAGVRRTQTGCPPAPASGSKRRHVCDATLERDHRPTKRDDTSRDGLPVEA